MCMTREKYLEKKVKEECIKAISSMSATLDNNNFIEQMKERHKNKEMFLRRQKGMVVGM